MLAENFPARIEVFYIDRKNGWCAAKYDQDGNQVGDSFYSFHQYDAYHTARAIYPHLPCHIFKMDGGLKRIISAK